MSICDESTQHAVKYPKSGHEHYFFYCDVVIERDSDGIPDLAFARVFLEHESGRQRELKEIPDYIANYILSKEVDLPYSHKAQNAQYGRAYGERR